jgi:glycosyltransferase involved in cell wall biosynthesis
MLPHMTRVLHVITDLRIGGAEQSLFRLLQQSTGDGIEHRVISLLDGHPIGDWIRELGVDVTSLGLRSVVGGPSVLMRIRRIAAEWQPDVLQGWMYHGCVASTLATWALSDRLSLAWNIRHSLIDIKHEKWLTQRVIRTAARLSSRADSIVWNSEVSRVQHEVIGFHGQRHAVIANGVDSEHMRPRPADRVAMRAAWGVRDDAMIVGSVARFHPMKGHQLLIEAVETLAKGGLDVHLALCGRGCEPGGPAEELARLAPSLADRVHFLGESVDPAPIYSGFDVFVAPSRWGESFPNTLVEAMSCGLPCVATDLGATTEIMGDAGFVVPPGDAAVLAPAIERAIKLPQAERRSLGAHGRLRVSSRYCQRKTTTDYESLWRTLGESSP